MIKLACLSLSYKRLFLENKMDVFSFIKQAYDLKFDGVDFNSKHIQSTDKDYLRKIKQQCIQYGLVISCIGISNSFAKLDEPVDNAINEVKKWIDVAYYLGAPIVRVFAGGATPENLNLAWNRAVQGLSEVSEYGQKAGIRVSLQNHNHTGIIKTGNDVLKMLNDVGSNLGYIMDTGQYAGSPGASGGELNSDFDFYKSMEQTAHLASLVRVKLYYGGSEASGIKNVRMDYTRIFQLLKKVKFNGFISLVYEGLDDEFKSVIRGNIELRKHLQKID